MCVKWSTPITNVVHGYVYFYVKLCTITENLYLDKFQFFTKCFKQQTYFFAAFLTTQAGPYSCSSDCTR